MDHDGKYYELTISVAYGKNGKIAYNISNMKERSFPQVRGSSNTNTGAQGGKLLSMREYPIRTRKASENLSPIVRILLHFVEITVPVVDDPQHSAGFITGACRE